MASVTLQLSESLIIYQAIIFLNATSLNIGEYQSTTKVDNLNILNYEPKLRDSSYLL
jgi:hypothetical protein